MHTVQHEAAPTETLSAPADRLISVREVEVIVGLRRSAIHNRVRDGRFPAPVKLSQRCSRWHMSAVHAWVAQQQPAVL